MIVNEVLERLAGDLKQFASTETIFGDQIEIQGSAIIPVCKMSIGYGGGGGEGTDADKSGGTGGGAGGGIKLEPSALIIAKDGEVSVVAIEGKSSALGKIVEMIPDTLEKVIKAQEKKEDKAEDKADSE